jgi:hypothetical protein
VIVLLLVLVLMIGRTDNTEPALLGEMYPALPSPSDGREATLLEATEATLLSSSL